MTAAVLSRPLSEQAESADDGHWFDVARPAPSAQQLLLDRNTGVTAAREFQVVETALAVETSSLDDEWASWLDAGLALGGFVEPQASSKIVAEPLHINELRLTPSRSFVGGGAMRLRRPRR